MAKRDVTPETFSELIDDELLTRYTIQRGGRKVRVTLIEIIADHLTLAMARGDRGATCDPSRVKGVPLAAW